MESEVGRFHRDKRNTSFAESTISCRPPLANV